MELQPLLHDRLVCLSAPTHAWSGPDGQIRSGGGIDGVYHADVRVLSRAVLTVDGHEPEAFGAGSAGSDTLRLSALARSLGGTGADPTVRLDRVRTIGPGEFAERVEVSCATPVEMSVSLTIAVDLAVMDHVRIGRIVAALDPTPTPNGGLAWSGSGVRVEVRADGADVDLSEPSAPVLTWRVAVGPDAPAVVGYRLQATDEGAVVAAATQRPWSVPRIDGGDDRLVSLVRQGLDDLGGLAMTTDAAAADTFLAAGAPWFFTLFGRDSLWAARMLLPLGTDLAAGTLRTLAARQGTHDDIETAEQPGKILHEVRRAAADPDDRTRLPPLYYGTVDATPLWLCLLHDAWRWGMPSEQVEALLPHAERALAWIGGPGDADGDGFLEYVDASGHGLANQGWKDSGDSIRWRDGTLAEGTIALCEVQAYAHEAALGGAALLETFGRPGAQRWRDWAAGLRARFRDQFWVADEDGPYPAIALDGAKRPVDSLTSNIGHLLGTGLLDPDEERIVADRLLSARLSSGFGLHTLAHGSGGFWPLSYHGGAVWPHDTAIAVTGLARAGLPEHAAELAEQLLTAAPGFGYRLPELFSGDRRDQVSTPAPYPAACRPQAWTAAAGVALLTASLGLDPDVPGGVLRVRRRPRGTSVDGLRLGTEPLRIAVGVDGQVELSTTAPVELGR